MAMANKMAMISTTTMSSIQGESLLVITAEAQLDVLQHVPSGPSG